jgi:hypothetical protein
VRAKLFVSTLILVRALIVAAPYVRAKLFVSTLTVSAVVPPVFSGEKSQPTAYSLT